MASSIIMQQTRGTATDIADLTPVDGQIVWDKTNNQIKIGNGTSKVSALKATPEIVNALNSTSANAVLSAAQGKALADRITTLENKPAGSNVTVTDNLTSTSTTAALSANQGRVLNSKIPTVSTATNSSSTTTAASSSAVKAAYDLANSANNKIPSGTYTTDTWTFTLSSGSTVSKTVVIKS